MSPGVSSGEKGTRVSRSPAQTGLSSPALARHPTRVFKRPATYRFAIRFLKMGSRFDLSISATPVSTNTGNGEFGSRK